MCRFAAARPSGCSAGVHRRAYPSWILIGLAAIKQVGFHAFEQGLEIGE
jgi:hypothetical protein